MSCTSQRHAPPPNWNGKLGRTNRRKNNLDFIFGQTCAALLHPVLHRTADVRAHVLQAFFFSGFRISLRHTLPIDHCLCECVLSFIFVL